MTITLPAITEADTSRMVVAKVLERWKIEGHSPNEINNGNCFEFADDVESILPDRFISIGIDSLMLYRGKWSDEEYAFDADLLTRQYPDYAPLNEHTWEEMFLWGVFAWPGIHAWAHCGVTGLCFDAETPEGIINPFALRYFEAHWKAMETLRADGIDLIKDGTRIRRLPSEAIELQSYGWQTR